MVQRAAVLCLIFISLCAGSARSQHYFHSAVWLRLAPNWEINERWSLTGDVWYRRQNALNGSLLNPLAAPLLSLSGRVGLRYQTDHWSYTLFPAALFQSHPSLGKAADYDRPMTQELRPSALVEWSTDVLPRLSLRLRGGYEYRRYAGGGTTGRARFRLMLRKELSETTYVSLWNETLTPIGPNVAVRQFYDTNRTNLAIGRNLSEHFVGEIGYQFSHRQRRTLIEFDEENALTLTGIVRF